MSKEKFKYAKAYPSDYLRNLDLGGKVQTVTITDWRYCDETDIGKNGEQMEGIGIFLTKTEKLFVLNVTNYGTIEGLHGHDPEEWKGKKITIYPTTCRFGRDPKHPCIRIKNKDPETGKDPDILQ